jgi:hypothetical protein
MLVAKLPLYPLDLTFVFFYVASVDIEFENNCEVGVSSKLTNAYCMVAIGGSYRLAKMFSLVLAWPCDFWWTQRNSFHQTYLYVPCNLSLINYIQTIL